MATYYFRSVGTAWNDTSSWSTTSSGGASAGAIPTAADDVIFDSGSANSCPVSTTAGVCLTFNSTGWTGTLTLNTSVTVSGNVRLSSTTVFSGTSFFAINATASITSNSATIPWFVLGSGTAMTLTLNDNLNVGIFGLEGITLVDYTMNGNNLFVTGDVQKNFSLQGNLLGTTVVNLIGTSNIFDTGASNYFWRSPLLINTSGTIIFSSFFIMLNSTFTYSAGTVDTSNTSFQVGGATTINADNMVFADLTIRGETAGFGTATTITLLANLSASILRIRYFFTQTITVNGAFTIFIGNRSGSIGSFIFTSVAGGSVFAGTATFEFTGEGGVGYWTASESAYGASLFRTPAMNVNITINTFGTLYIIQKGNSAANIYNIQVGGSRTFRYTKGNVITQNLHTSPILFPEKGANLTVATGHTLIGMDKIAWGRITIAGGATITMSEFPQGNSTVITSMVSSTAANYTVTLTGRNRERIANFVKVQRCTIALASRRNTIVLTYPYGNRGGNIGLLFGDRSGNALPKRLDEQTVYGNYGFYVDPAISRT